jgi:hypothetical protein
MKNVFANRVVLVLLISLTSTGCGSSFGKRLEAAATDIGIASARVQLEDPPSDCVATEPDPVLSVGTEARVAIRKFKRAKDRQNARTVRCLVAPDGWYPTYKRELAGKSK